MRASEISGNIYWNGALREGTVFSSGGRIEFIDSRKTGAEMHGTLIPFPINSHTHIGDSFIHDEPVGSLPDIVGPGGFKHSKLAEASSDDIIRGMERTIRFMEDSCNLLFIDFRESGINGIKNISAIKSQEVSAIILGRPSAEVDNVDQILSLSHGVGLSSVSDGNMDYFRKVSGNAKKRGKVLALHFSENEREDIQEVLSLNPDLLIHGIEASDNDLELVAERGIPIAITPRSNIFFGKRPDYSRLAEHGISLLLGTDNVMVVEPDIFTEMDFLYKYQRSRGRISPSDILKTTIDNPRTFLENKRIGFTKNRFVFFRDVFLNDYELVTKSRYFRKEAIEIVPDNS